MNRLDWRWLDVPFLGTSVRSWLLAFAIAAAAYLALMVIKRLVVRRVGRIAGRTATEVDDFVVDMVRRTRRWLVLLPVIYFGSLFLTLPAHVESVLRSAAIVAVLLQIALWALIGIDFWVARTRRKRLAADAATVSLIGVLGFIGKLVLWTLMVLLVLDNLGVNVTALVAGLGVGGIAIALALQNILGDLFASLSIVLDKPFVLGDSIQVDDFNGTVESIGLKTTRLRSVSGEQIIFPNGNLLQSRIRNHKRMTERRIAFVLRVAQGTPAEALEKIPAMVREIVEGIEGREQVRFDRAHLKSLADWSLDFEVVYFVTTPDYNVYLDRQQAINLALLRRFEEAGIALAFPTRTVRIEGPPPLGKETSCADGS
jgi:small-conductance mechanosensitive channel